MNNPEQYIALRSVRTCSGRLELSGAGVGRLPGPVATHHPVEKGALAFGGEFFQSGGGAQTGARFQWFMAATATRGGKRCGPAPCQPARVLIVCADRALLNSKSNRPR